MNLIKPHDFSTGAAHERSDTEADRPVLQHRQVVAFPGQNEDMTERCA